MSNDWQVPWQRAAPGVAELFDPVGLEARIVEARARRSEALARRAGGAEGATTRDVGRPGPRMPDLRDLCAPVRPAGGALVSRGRTLPALPGRLARAASLEPGVPGGVPQTTAWGSLASRAEVLLLGFLVGASGAAAALIAAQVAAVDGFSWRPGSSSRADIGAMAAGESGTARSAGDWSGIAAETAHAPSARDAPLEDMAAVAPAARDRPLRAPIDPVDVAALPVDPVPAIPAFAKREEAAPARGAMTAALPQSDSVTPGREALLTAGLPAVEAVGKVGLAADQPSMPSDAILPAGRAGVLAPALPAVAALRQSDPARWLGQGDGLTAALPAVEAVGKVGAVADQPSMPSDAILPAGRAGVLAPALPAVAALRQSDPARWLGQGDALTAALPAVEAVGKVGLVADQPSMPSDAILPAGRVGVLAPALPAVAALQQSDPARWLGQGDERTAALPAVEPVGKVGLAADQPSMPSDAILPAGRAGVLAPALPAVAALRQSDPARWFGQGDERTAALPAVEAVGKVGLVADEPSLPLDESLPARWASLGAPALPAAAPLRQTDPVRLTWREEPLAAGLPAVEAVRGIGLAADEPPLPSDHGLPARWASLRAWNAPVTGDGVALDVARVASVVPEGRWQPAEYLPPVLPSEPALVADAASGDGAPSGPRFAAAMPDAATRATLAWSGAPRARPADLEYVLLEPRLAEQPPAAASKRKSAKVTPLRASREAARPGAAGAQRERVVRQEPDARVASAERVQRIRLERTVEGMLRDKLLRN